MTEEVILSRTANANDDLVVETDDDGFYHIRRGPPGKGNRIASESRVDRARLADWSVRIADRLFGPPAKIAHIGAGTCYLPRICNLKRWNTNTTQHIYELEQAIATWAAGKFPAHAPLWTFTVGDYVSTLTGTYQVIVYDVPAPPNLAVLNAHLAPGGLRLGW